MIGITITTRNRPRVLEYSLKRFKQHLSEDHSIVVIDDNSDTADLNKEIVLNEGFVYLYNDKRYGIPRSKERGFRCHLHCDYQMWFDDDCFPLVDNWSDPFIEAMKHQGHLLHLKPWAFIKEKQVYKQGVTSYTGATACFMTFRKDMYDKIHGFSAPFSKYGHWHSRLSLKMSNYGLDEYVAITRSSDYLHSFDVDGVPSDFDYHFQSCMSQQERREELEKWKP